MPLQNYGLLKGKILNRIIDRDPVSPHYHVLVEAGTLFHVAINVWSTHDQSPLLHFIDQEFEHPLTDLWLQLSRGFTPLSSQPESGAIDYVRGQFLSSAQMRIAPNEPVGEGGLTDLLDLYITRTIASRDATLYAFGTRWGPNPGETDRTFRDSSINPSDGLHDVHMNQGNPDRPSDRDLRHFNENGPWQDGAVLLHFPKVDQWVGLFLAFQSQSWHTDKRSGKPLVATVRLEGEGSQHENDRFGDVRIVAAMVNPAGPALEVETVTLINTTGAAIALQGWIIVNARQQPTHLDGPIQPRQRRVIDIAESASLGNLGGTIHLLDEFGVKIDGVAYTRLPAGLEGRLLVF